MQRNEIEFLELWRDVLEWAIYWALCNQERAREVLYYIGHEELP